MNERQSRRMRWARIVLRLLGRVAFAVAWLWLIGAAWYSGLGPALLPRVLALGIAVGFPLAWYRHERRRVLVVFATALALAAGLWTLKTPKHKALWAADLAHVPVASVDGDLVTIDGVRDCIYRTPEDFDVRYRIQTFDLRTLRSLDYVVERFHAFDGLAHTLLTFGFEDGQHLAISVEIRREEGEHFNPIAGLFREFELTYVIGTEQDLIGLRTHHRGSQVWLYPIRTSPQRMQDLLRSMLQRAQHLAEAPEFYNTITSTCTTNLVDHVVQLVPDRIPWSWRMVLPGYSAELAHELGLIATDLGFEQAQERFRIDEHARGLPLDADFPRRLRERAPP